MMCTDYVFVVQDQSIGGPSLNNGAFALTTI